MAKADKKEDGKIPADPRVVATSAISGSTIALLGICIPLVAILRSPVIVFFVLGGAALAIACVWNPGRSKEVESKTKDKEKEIVDLKATVEDLKARLEDVEVINRFETTLAERALADRDAVGDVAGDDSDREGGRGLRGSVPQGSSEAS